MGSLCCQTKVEVQRRLGCLASLQATGGEIDSAPCQPHAEATPRCSFDAQRNLWVCLNDLENCLVAWATLKKPLSKHVAAPYFETDPCLCWQVGSLRLSWSLAPDSLCGKHGHVLRQRVRCDESAVHMASEPSIPRWSSDPLLRV